MCIQRESMIVHILLYRDLLQLVVILDLHKSVLSWSSVQKIQFTKTCELG